MILSSCIVPTVATFTPLQAVVSKASMVAIRPNSNPLHCSVYWRMHRCILWNYIPTSLLPKLPRASTSSILEAYRWRSLIFTEFFTKYISRCRCPRGEWAVRTAQACEASAVCQPQSPRRSEASCRPSVSAEDLWVPSERAGEEWAEDAVDETAAAGSRGTGYGGLEGEIL